MGVDLKKGDVLKTGMVFWSAGIFGTWKDLGTARAVCGDDEAG